MHRLITRRAFLERTVPGRQKARNIHHDLRLAPRAKATHHALQKYLHANPTLLNIAVRSFSTDPPPVTQATPTDKPPPVHVGLKPKSKVELRPAPVKPGPINASNAPRPTAALAPQPAVPTEELAPTHSEKSSVVEIAKRDLEDAAKHGVFKPVPEGAGFVGRMWHQMKELVKFYYAGVKLIWAHRKRVQAIHARVKAGGPPITRAESRFIITYMSDRLKLVPFVLMAIILEEIIPIVVIYAPGILPSTCILPSQRERIENTLHERQKAMVHEQRQLLKTLAVPGADTSLLGLDDGAVNAFCGVFGLSTRGLTGMKRKRLAKHLRRIAEDDTMLLSEGEGVHLSDAEVAEALWERGLILDARTAVDRRKLLTWWLDNCQSRGRRNESPDSLRIRLVSTLAAR